MSLNDFLLNPEETYLNHGSYGATPKPVLAAQMEWKQKMERQPVHFMHRILPGAYLEALERAAQFINADRTGLAFVPNATTGCNAVLQNLTFLPGDEILTTNHRYDAVYNTLSRHADRQRVKLVVANLPFGASDSTIANSLHEATTPRTRLLVLDHISSATATLFPVYEITRAFQEKGIMVLIDAAHSPGQIDVDLKRLNPDFWTGNLHKWCCSPKGSALLYVSEKHRTRFHAPVISHGYRKGFYDEMSWMGTADFSAYLASVTALDLHDKWGGKKFRLSNAKLQEEATDLILKQMPHLTTVESSTLAMRSFMTPYANAEECYEYLLAQHGIELFINTWQERTLFRISCFGKYNSLDDYQTLINGLKAWELTQANSS